MKRDSMKQDHKDKALRGHVLYLLDGGGAHAKSDEVVADIPRQLLGQKPARLPHSLWMLLEHLRIAQRDILDFSHNPEYVSPKWPEGYWPKMAAPPSPAAWTASVKQFRGDLKSMKDLVKDPKTDLFAKIPWGDGQTVLREALLLADHNAYHLGQMLDVRRLLGAWPEK
jgi:hypothetical protein